MDRKGGLRLSRRIKLALAVIAMSCGLTGVMSLIFYGEVRGPMMLTGLVCAVVIDYVISRITFRYRAALRAANDKLEARVTERTASLQAANEQLALEAAERQALQEHLIASERMSAAGAMAAAVSHEIRNPLMAINFNLEYARGVASEAGKQGLVEALDGALEGTEQVQRITVDLATLANPNADEVDAVDLEAALSAASRLAAPQLRGAASLRIDLDSPPPVAANASRLVQVFLNLINNAVQATEAGRDNTIWVTSTHDERSVWVTVRDTGRGISAAQLPEVLEPFFTTKHDEGGTGLGLSICKNIVESFRGELEIESVPGEGTRVRVRLCVAEVLLEQPPTPGPMLRPASAS